MANIPRLGRRSFRTQAFSVAGPTVWNSRSDSLRDPAVRRRAAAAAADRMSASRRAVFVTCSRHVVHQLYVASFL